MKKVLLLSAVAAMSAAAVNAIEPQILDDVMITKLSPDGKLGASDNGSGTVKILDFVNDKEYEYLPTEDLTTAYSVAYGNAISENGVIIGSLYLDDASYWVDGKWTTLTASCTEGTRTAYSITRDGRRIVGLVATPNSNGFDGLLGVPGYWDRNEDGTYSDFKPLPYPNTDFTGRTPQYITANAISDDGKLIAGQVRDYSGMWHTPILFKENEKGEWSYSLYHPELLNPTGVKFPDPEEILPDVEMPDANNYLTESQKAAYDEAMANYDWNSGDPWPQPVDFLEGESLKEYEEALAPYAAWYAQWEEIQSKVAECEAAGGAQFVFNNVYLSGDGKTLAMTNQRTLMDDPLAWMPTIIYDPYIFNLEKDEIKNYKDDNNNLYVSFVSGNGAVLAWKAGDINKAFVLSTEKDAFIPFEDYVKSISLETAAWMTENMTQSCMVGFDDITGDFIYEDALVTGIPTATADFTTFATYTETWAFEYIEGMPNSYSYMFTIDNPAGVALPVEGGNLAIAIVDGAIMLNGDAASVAVYDLNGRLVMNVANPGTKVETTLASGFYIVKAVVANGEAVTVKAAL